MDPGFELNLTMDVQEQIERVLAQAPTVGVEGLLVGVPPAPPAQMMKACEAIARLSAKMAQRPRIVGIRLRGPFLNGLYVSEQELPYVRRPDAGLVEELLAAGGGGVRLLTLSPELPGASQLVQQLADRGVAVGAACSGLSFDQGLRTFRDGVRFVENTFFAMARFHHREPGLIGAAFLSPGVSLELRPSPGGLHPAMVKIALGAVGPERLVLSGQWSCNPPLAGSALLRYVADHIGIAAEQLLPAMTSSIQTLLSQEPENVEVQAR
ncbi:MAG: hypothetical protein ACM3ZA_07835 [Bacillota bacterium]